MKKQHHYLLWGLGIAAGGYVAYRYVYQPWAAQQALLAATPGATPVPGGGGLLSTLFPMPAATAPIAPYNPGPISTGAAYVPAPVTTPTPANAITAPVALPLPQATTTGLPTSIGPQYTGPVGACIRIKGNTWTADQCQTRLDALVMSYSNAQQWITNYQATVSQAQQTLAAEQAALVNATRQMNAASAAGDAVGAELWREAVAGHTADIADLQQRIGAAPGQLAAYQAALAANDSDYYNLTQSHIGG